VLHHPNRKHAITLRKGILEKGDIVPVLRDIMVAAIDTMYAVSILLLLLFLVLHLFTARRLDLRRLVWAKPLALLVCMANMLELAFASLVVRAVASLRKVWALEHMLLVTSLALVAVAKQRERATNEGGRGYGHVGIAACILGAVAGHVVGASGDTVVGRPVGEIAQGTLSARAGEKEGLADGDLGSVVGKAAFRAVGTGTCDSVRGGNEAYRQGRHDVV